MFREYWEKFTPKTVKRDVMGMGLICFTVMAAFVVFSGRVKLKSDSIESQSKASKISSLVKPYMASPANPDSPEKGLQRSSPVPPNHEVIDEQHLVSGRAQHLRNLNSTLPIIDLTPYIPELESGPVIPNRSQGYRPEVEEVLK